MAQRFQISADTEAQVRAVLKVVPVDRAAVAARPAYRNLRERVLDVYARVAAEGFADAAVQAALRALLGSGGDISVGAAFDWLCINAPEALPAKFAAGERHASKGGTVTVLASARDDVVLDTAARRTCVASPPPGEPREFDAGDRSRADGPHEDEREREKAWIRRYMEEQSDEEDDLGDSADVQPHTDVAGQQQVDSARSQAHLAALSDSVESRQALARELQRARGEAKQAKAQGDASSQQRAGSIIRVVREQLERLSITEADCFAALSAADLEEPGDGGSAPAAAPVAAEEEFGAMFDEAAASAAPRVPRAPALSTILSHAARQPGATRAKQGKPAVAAPQALQLPRSVLQQHCARQLWPAPRFERMPAGSSGMRYSVTLSCDLPGRRGKRQMQTITVELPTDCTLGSSIEEAQNAVATRALYQLLPYQPVHRELAAPYGGLWLGWMEAAALNGTDEIRDREAATSAFVDSLLAEEAVRSRASRTDGQQAQASGANAGDRDQAWEARVPQPARSSFPAPGARDFSAVCTRLREQLLSRERDAAYADIMKQRASLPIAAVRNDIAAALSGSDMLVVCGETGCGKTTQVPQFLLDDAIMRGSGASCSIIVTQPRRVAAMSVADRVAFERLEAAPGAPGASVGYQVRLDAARTSATQLLFCTAGILLRRLHGDALLEGTSHVVVDEVHERSLQTDLLLTILRDLSARRIAAGRPGVKVVLMSATVDATFFAGYLEGCPVVTALGRSFPVEEHYLEDVYEACSYLLPLDSPAALRPAKNAHRSQIARGGDRQRVKLVEEGWGDEECARDGGYDALNKSYDPALYDAYGEKTRKSLARLNEAVIDYDLLEELLSHVHDSQGPGAVLVFMPGIREVNVIVGRLSAMRRFRDNGSVILPLHSALSASDQRRVFQRPASGIRKIVVATNIAETSLTIPDVVYVVDSGRQKCRQYDPRRGMSSLEEEWVSQANARQRQGRAGRVQPGKYYALFTRQRAASLRPFPQPEMGRVSLTETALQIKKLDLGSVDVVLSRAPDPPTPEAVRDAITTLTEAGALDSAGALTPLGHHLARLPVDVRVGKIIVLGAVLGCLRPSLTIAAYLSSKSPFVAPHEERDAADRVRVAFAAPKAPGIAAGQFSDHLVVVAAYDAWRTAVASGGTRAGADFCRRHFLCPLTLAALHGVRPDMRGQFAELLADAGFFGNSTVRRSALEAADDAAMTWNAHAAHAQVIRDGVLCAGLYPQVAVGAEVDGRAEWTVGNGKVAVHPSSVNHQRPNLVKLSPFLLFHEKMLTSQVFIRECSAVSPAGLLLFGGAVEVQYTQSTATVDGRIKLRVDAQTAVLVKTLRVALDQELRVRIANPASAANAPLLAVIVKLLTAQKGPE